MDLRRVAIGLVLASVVAGCGGDPPTVSAYAAEVEHLVAGMEVQFAALDDDWESKHPSLTGALEYWDSRLGIRNDFLAGIEELEPPDEVAVMHEAAVDVFKRMTDADIALQARVAGFETIDDHWQWVDTPEGRAADEVLEEVFAFCRASQEEFDSTRDRANLDESAWLPAEMREVVRVAFGCPAVE